MSKKALFLPAIYLAVTAVTGCGSGSAKPSDGGIGGSAGNGGTAGGAGGGAASIFLGDGLKPIL